MDNNSVVMAALAPAGGETFTPVQIQKLLFLIESNIAGSVGGPHFNFQPYDYGPFDSSVYHVLDQLVLNGLVEALEVPGRKWKKYRLTTSGQQEGEISLSSINDEKIRNYISEVSLFVQGLSFPQLVSAIYKAYPEMKVNSVFGG